MGERTDGGYMYILIQGYKKKPCFYTRLKNIRKKIIAQKLEQRR